MRNGNDSYRFFIADYLAKHLEPRYRESITVIDVGARAARVDYFEKLGALLDYIGFEPDKNECDKLNSYSNKKYKHKYHAFAISENSGSFPLFITKDVDCSSLLEPNPDKLRLYGLNQKIEIAKVETIETISLKEFLDRNSIKMVSHIKLDVQGAELAILKGSESRINDICSVEVEVEFIEVYKNQPLFSDIDSFLRSHGFIMLSIAKKSARINNSVPLTIDVRGQLVWGDAFYFRTPEWVLEENDKEKAFLKAISQLLFFEKYNSPDYALQYLDIFCNNRSVFEESNRKIFEELKNEYQTVLMETKRYGKLSSLFYSILSKRIFAKLLFAADDAIARIKRDRKPQHQRSVWPESLN